MKNQFKFSILEIMVVIAIILLLMTMIMPALQLVKDKANRTKTMNNARSIGLIMVTYGEDDLKGNKMPYPVGKLTVAKGGGSEKWGSDFLNWPGSSWSARVAEMLFDQKYMRLGEESQLLSAGAGEGYVPLILPVKTLDPDPAAKPLWDYDPATPAKEPGTLDFLLYCDPTLTSNVSGKLVLVATLDNDPIKNCQFGGSGWVVFYADKTAEFIKRANVKSFKETDLISDIDSKLLGAAAGKFGKSKGGGSSELMGKRDSDVDVYQKLVR